MKNKEKMENPNLPLMKIIENKNIINGEFTSPITSQTDRLSIFVRSDHIYYARIAE